MMEEDFPRPGFETRYGLNPGPAMTLSVSSSSYYFHVQVALTVLFEEQCSNLMFINLDFGDDFLFGNGDAIVQSRNHLHVYMEHNVSPVSKSPKQLKFETHDSLSQ